MNPELKTALRQHPTILYSDFDIISFDAISDKSTNTYNLVVNYYKYVDLSTYDYGMTHTTGVIADSLKDLATKLKTILGTSLYSMWAVADIAECYDLDTGEVLYTFSWSDYMVMNYPDTGAVN